MLPGYSTWCEMIQNGQTPGGWCEYILPFALHPSKIQRWMKSPFGCGFLGLFSEGKTFQVVQFQGVVWDCDPNKKNWAILSQPHVLEITLAQRTTRVSVGAHQYHRNFRIQGTHEDTPKPSGVCDQCHAVHDAWRPKREWEGHGNDVRFKKVNRDILGGQKCLT